MAHIFRMYHLRILISSRVLLYELYRIVRLKYIKLFFSVGANFYRFPHIFSVFANDRVGSFPHSDNTKYEICTYIYSFPIIAQPSYFSIPTSHSLTKLYQFPSTSWTSLLNHIVKVLSQEIASSKTGNHMLYKLSNLYKVSQQLLYSHVPSCCLFRAEALSHFTFLYHACRRWSPSIGHSSRTTLLRQFHNLHYSVSSFLKPQKITFLSYPSRCTSLSYQIELDPPTTSIINMFGVKVFSIMHILTT